MKKLYIITLLAFCLSSALESAAQGIYQLWGSTAYGGPDDIGVLFSTKYDGTGQSIKKTFTATNPGKPWEGNKPVAYNNKFYSMLREGGVYGEGIISEYDPVTNTYIKRADLHGLSEYGPESALIVYNNKLYGTISQGGSNAKGVLIEFNPANGAITVRHEFTEATGEFPSGDLVVYNNKLYGITASGGFDDAGVIFEFDPVTNIYTKKRDFLKAVTGENTHGSLIVYDNKLWGVSWSSTGPQGGGYIFSYDPLANILTGKVELGAINGSRHSGAMAILNGKFYGSTNEGGANDEGLLFQYDPATNILTKEMDYTATTISRRFTMVTYNNLLYGASGFGANGNGGIFSYNPVTNAYSGKVLFSDATGGSSVGSVMLYNNKIYWWNYFGGLYGEGSLFEYDPVANSYAIKVQLGSADLFRPMGQMVYHNNKLYGAAIFGGNHKEGGIYEYDIATQSYSIKRHMENSSGQFGEQGAFTIYNNKFYGVTYTGGVNDSGTLFEYDPAANTYIVRHNFSGPDGKFPQGKLAEFGGKLYGTTYKGGMDDNGTIFEFDPNTNTFSLRVNFDGTRGRNPNAGLTVYNGKVYGVASIGGANGAGTLFEYLPLANGLIKRADFDINTTGAYPRGGLVAFNNKLYGLTHWGIEVYSGKLYEYDITNMVLAPKIDLSTALGRYAVSGMILVNNKLYGMTNIGGDEILGGVLFEYDPVTNNYTKKINFNGNNGRLPRYSELTRAPAPVAPGSPGSCSNANFTTITAANSNEWIPFTDAQGRAVAEINANGNILGTVQVRYYINNGAVRQKAGNYYLDRNITISSQNSPASPVSVRLYIRKTEFDALKNAPGSGVAMPDNIAVFKNDDFCANQLTASANVLTTTMSSWGEEYVYTVEVNSFSSFYFASSLAVLPVHILSFKGQAEAAANKLEWLASCTNAVDFTIERSKDGNNFQQVGLVWAQQQDCDHPFIFRDQNPPAKAWYRLKMVEYNGPAKYSNAILINREGQEISGAGIFPNPVQGTQANLQINSTKKMDLSFTISDAMGRIVMQRRVQVNAGVNSFQLDLKNFPAGVYQLVYNNESTNQVVRFVKL